MACQFFSACRYTATSQALRVVLLNTSNQFPSCIKAKKCSAQSRTHHDQWGQAVDNCGQFDFISAASLVADQLSAVPVSIG